MLVLALLATGASLAQAPVETYRTSRGLVVSQSSIASDVGAEVLRRGGNAVDAAVATALALAVTLPEAGNIGGGGFLVARLPDGSATTFDFRERAPLRATADMFLDEKGEYDPRRHHWSYFAVGVPGTVAGLVRAHERLGRLPWKALVEPAVSLARNGFLIDQGLAESLESAIDDLRRHPAARAQFTRDGEPFAPGERLVQEDLARSLERIRDHGHDGFYRGETARLIVAEMERGGGLVSAQDLESYEAVERSPVRGSYRGLEIISMGPPSSGGVALVEMLHILEGFDLRAAGFRSAQEVHWITEAMRRAFADRARYLADPDFVEVPIERLVSPEHANELRATIRPDRASRSAPDRFEWSAESTETTHLSVVDSDRMAVSLTLTLEESYGARIVVAGAGFLLNNELGDFNPRAGLTTEGGWIGTSANLAAPGKRPLSSMTPAIVASERGVELVVGSPGGRTIINTVLQVILNVVDHGQSMQQAVDAPRFHHQWLPDELVIERFALSPDSKSRLEAMGHRIRVRSGSQGSAMGIRVLRNGVLEAGVDRRRFGAGAAGH